MARTTQVPRRRPPGRSRLEPPGSEAVGRFGVLELEYDRRGDATTLTSVRCTSPWHFLPPAAIEDTDSLCTFLVNPSGGLVGGDRLDLSARLGAGTHVILTTPSATRVYRSLGEPAVQAAELRVGTGAVLEWVPEATIPFAGSRFEQDIRATVEPGGTILLWDAIASGRIARGERWAFARLESRIRVDVGADSSVVERVEIVPGATNPGLAVEWDYVATLLVIGQALTEGVRKDLGGTLADILDRDPQGVLGGVSEAPAPGLCLKLVARSGPHLSTAFEALWGAVRGRLWGVGAPALRRY